MHCKSQSHSALHTITSSATTPFTDSSLTTTTTTTTADAARQSSRPSGSRYGNGREDAGMSSLPGLTESVGIDLYVGSRTTERARERSGSRTGSRSRALDMREEGGIRRSNTGVDQLSRIAVMNTLMESGNSKVVSSVVNSSSMSSAASSSASASSSSSSSSSSSRSRLKRSSTTTGISDLTNSRCIPSDIPNGKEKQGMMDKVRRKGVEESFDSTLRIRDQVTIPTSSTGTTIELHPQSSSSISQQTPIKSSHSRSHSMSTTTSMSDIEREETPRVRKNGIDRSLVIENEDDSKRRRRRGDGIQVSVLESPRRRREVKEEDLESRLRKVVSLRTSHGSRMKTLANLERELGSIAPKRREDVVGDKLIKFLKSNVHIPLLHLFNRNVAVIFTLSQPASREITQALLDELGVVLNLLQGLCMLDRRTNGCVSAAGEEYVIEAMLDLLYHLSASSTVDYSTGTTGGNHVQPNVIQIQLIDLLYPILLASSIHITRFSTADGLSTIRSLVVGDGVTASQLNGTERGDARREVKMKCVEFLIFWDMLMKEEEGRVEKGEELTERSAGLYSGRTSSRSDKLKESPILASPIKQMRRSPIGRSAPIEDTTRSTVSMSTDSISTASTLAVTPNTAQRHAPGQVDRVSSGGSSSSSSFDTRRSSITSSSSTILRTPRGADLIRSSPSSDELVRRSSDAQPRTPRKERHSMAPSGMTSSATLGFLTPQINRVSRSYGLPGDGRNAFADDQALMGRPAPVVTPSRSRDRLWGDSRKVSSIKLGAVIEEHANGTGDTPRRTSHSPDTTFGTDVDESMHSTWKEDQTPRRRTPVDARPSTETESTSSRVDGVAHQRGKSFGALAMASGIGLGLPGGAVGAGGAAAAGAGGLTRSETARRRVSPLSTSGDDVRSVGGTRVKKTSGGGMRKSATSMGLSGLGR